MVVCIYVQRKVSCSEKAMHSVKREAQIWLDGDEKGDNFLRMVQELYHI